MGVNADALRRPTCVFHGEFVHGSPVAVRSCPAQAVHTLARASGWFLRLDRGV
jgi:hypothetical protein